MAGTLWIPLLAPVLFFYALISVFLKESPFNRVWIVLPVSAGLGIGCSSWLYGVILLLAGPPGFGYFYFEIPVILCISAILILLPRHGNTFSPKGQDAPAVRVPVCEKMLCGAFLLLAALAAVIFFLISLKGPHGGWDAWAVWNLKARFLFRDGEAWTHAFSPLIDWSHPDYPLLLPGAVARLWTWAGAELFRAPVTIAFLFTFSTVALLTSSAGLLKGRTQGLLGGILLLGTLDFIGQGASQYADIPLAFFMLGALVCTFLVCRDVPMAFRWMLLSGALAGCAAWTKNEGTLFAAALILGWMVAGGLRHRWKQATKEALCLLAGALPFLLLLAWFKFRFAPAGDLFARQEAGAMLHKLLDIDRHMLIIKTFLWGSLKMGGPLVLGIGLILLREKAPAKTRAASIAGWVTLGCMLAGYYAVYLITPYDLGWHLSTTADRLLMHLWPPALFLSVLRLRSNNYSR
jgi:hypothetical protein